MTVIDGRGLFGGRSLSEQVTAWNLGHVKDGQVVMPAPPPATDLADALPLLARVDHGRWLVDCDTCKSAEAIWYDAPMMFCRSCRNPSTHGMWRKVALPKERNDIIAILNLRPTQHQNWSPGDTLEELRADNELHQIGVYA